MKILFINLADFGPLGRKSVAGLKRKYGDENVDLVDAIDIDIVAAPESLLQRLRNPIASYDRIILGAHGHVDDITHCYCERVYGAPYERTFDYKQLAAGMLRCFRAAGLPGDHTLRLVFAICYGARTSEFRRDHIQQADSIDFRDSFAACFLREFKQYSKGDFGIELSAYTGSVEFNQDSGELCVETEEQILQGTKLESSKGGLALLEQKLSALTSSYSHAELEQYEANEEYLTDASELGAAYLQYFELSERITQLQCQVSQRPAEYGRILFRSDIGSVGFTTTVNGSFSGAEILESESVVVNEETPLLGGDGEPDAQDGCCSGCRIS